jgi:hypothetical protein
MFWTLIFTVNADAGTIARLEGWNPCEAGKLSGVYLC